MSKETQSLNNLNTSATYQYLTYELSNAEYDITEIAVDNALKTMHKSILSEVIKCVEEMYVTRPSDEEEIQAIVLSTEAFMKKFYDKNQDLRNMMLDMLLK